MSVVIIRRPDGCVFETDTMEEAVELSRLLASPPTPQRPADRREAIRRWLEGHAPATVRQIAAGCGLPRGLVSGVLSRYPNLFCRAGEVKGSRRPAYLWQLAVRPDAGRV